jgi:hypothetical protein
VAVYFVRADSNLLGALNTDATGAVDSSWSTAPHGRVLSLLGSVSPSSVRLIEVTNEAGMVELTGSLQLM